MLYTSGSFGAGYERADNTNCGDSEEQHSMFNMHSGIGQEVRNARDEVFNP